MDWAGEDLAAVWADNDRPVACTAIGAVEVASAQDSRTFADMDAAATVADAALYGAAFRLKSPSSLARKITTKQGTAVDRGEYLEASAATKKITDVTRYTALTAEHDEIVPTAQATIAELGQRGWKVIEAEQSYVSGNAYKGLHLLVQQTDGQVAELQIQSAQSQEIKEHAHTLYEKSRDTSRPRAERMDASRKSKELYEDLPAPEGLSYLTELGGCPVTEKLYTPVRKRRYT